MQNAMGFYVSIPQAVSTVATVSSEMGEDKQVEWVSIPQAVSTVATCLSLKTH